MVKNIVWVIVVIVIFITSIILLVKLNEKNQISENINLKTELKELTYIIQNSNKATIIDFSKITDFKWESMYIITPYTNIKEYFDTVEIEGYNFIKTSIETNDSINLIVFVSDNKIISYINFDRIYGDFDLSMLRQQSKFSKEDAIFEVIKENNILKLIKF